MIKICFVCLGNICRSPMAECIMENKLKELNITNILVTSKATSNEEEGNQMHIGTLRKLQEEKIPVKNHIATQLKKADYLEYDYFIGMDSSNILSMKNLFNGDSKNKVTRLLDYTELKRDIKDPWYTKDFTATYQDIDYGVTKLIEILKNST